MYDKSFYKAIWGNELLLKTAQTHILRLLIVVSLLMLFFQILDIDVIVSILFHSSFLLVGFLWLTTLPHFGINDWIAIFAIATAFFCVFLNAVMSGVVISIFYFKKIVFFSATLIFFATSEKVSMDKELENLLHIFVYSVTIIMVFAIIFGGTKMYEIDGAVSRYLTFGFSNPNFTAMVIFCLLCFIMAFFFDTENKVEKSICICLLPTLVLFLLKTNSRNALLVFVAFFMLVFFAWFYIKKRNRISRWLAFLVALWPLIFAGLYFFVVTNETISNYLSFLTTEGKGLDSRVQIWQFAFENYKNWPLIGAYNQVFEYAGENHHMHNTHIDTLASYGPVVLGLVSVLFYRLLRGCSINIFSRAVYLSGFVCVILLGMGESALFTGGLSFYILAGFMLMLACGGNEQSGKKTNV